MAKEASVIYKLPIEQMRGKLATKQDGVMYAGQERGENTLSIGEGNHAATNFEKYIVVTVSRGKNRFYVKSRATVANSIGTVNTRAILALAMPLVDAIYARRDDALEMVPFKESHQYFQKGETLREYLTRVVVESIRRGKNNIEYYSKPNQQGLSEYVALIPNPYVHYNTAVVTLFNGGRNFGSDAREARIIQEYLPYRALQMGGKVVTIRVHNTVSGSTYLMKIVVALNEETTMTELAGTTQSAAFRITATTEEITGITLFPFKLNYSVSGKPYLDAEKTQKILPAQVVNNITDLYI